MDNSSNSSDCDDLIITASGGNTRPQNQHDIARDLRKPQISPAKRWCFTIFNFNDDNWKTDVSSMFSRYDKFCVGLEICPKTLNKHLQGFCEFAKKERPLTRFAKVFPGIHFEKTKGTVDENLKYCSKDGNYILQNYTITRKFNVTNVIDQFQKDRDLFGQYITRTEFHDYVFDLCRRRVLAYPVTIARQKEVCNVCYQFCVSNTTATIDDSTRVLDQMVRDTF